MSLYADSNALVRLYLQSPDCELIAKELNHDAALVTDLTRFEVTNAIERMVFESRGGSAWRVTPEMAAVAQADFAEQIKRGTFLKLSPLTLTDIEAEFDSLARRHTASHGFRTYDIMHVSSAVTLRCQRFLSFDTKANALARLAGLHVFEIS